MTLKEAIKYVNNWESPFEDRELDDALEILISVAQNQQESAERAFPWLK